MFLTYDEGVNRTTTKDNNIKKDMQNSRYKDNIVIMLVQPTKDNINKPTIIKCKLIIKLE